MFTTTNAPMELGNVVDAILNHEMMLKRYEAETQTSTPIGNCIHHGLQMTAMSLSTSASLERHYPVAQNH